MCILYVYIYIDICYFRILLYTALSVKAESSDVFVQDAHQETAHEEQPSVFACCVSI